MGKVGAPKGGRVHWFLYELPMYVRTNYFAFYNYAIHDYMLFRKCKKMSDNNFLYADLFIVKRSSHKCWKVMAFNVETSQTEYRAFKRSTEAGQFICELAPQWHDGREWTQDREYIENDLKTKK